MTKRASTLVLIVFALLVIALFTRNSDVAWMALPFLVYLGIGIVQAPSPENIRLVARRSIDTKRNDGVSSIEVNVAVSNKGTSIDRLRLVDPLQAGMRITDGHVLQEVALRAGEETH